MDIEGFVGIDRGIQHHIFEKVKVNDIGSGVYQHQHAVVGLVIAELMF